MNIYEISGRHVDITDAMRSYITDRLNELGPLSEEVVDAKVVVSYKANPKVREAAKVEVQLNLPNTIVRAEERSEDAYAAIDKVAGKLERQLKRYTGRRQAKRRPAPSTTEAAPTNAASADLGEHSEHARELGMDSISRIKKHVLRPMTPDDATLQMEGLGHGFYMFRNATSGEINVVYMRHDGSYGLLEPAG